MMKLYTINKNFTVFAKSFDQAVKLFNQQHPDQQVNEVKVDLEG
jgi:hypothetical protein